MNFKFMEEKKFYFQVWLASHVNTEGEVEPAYYMGSVEAGSFQEACDHFFLDYPEYSPYYLTLKGIPLHSNEAEAKKV